MNIAKKIRNDNFKLYPGEDYNEPVNEEKLLIDCMIHGEKVEEGVYVFKDQSVLDTIDSFTKCYKSLTEYYLSKRQ